MRMWADDWSLDGRGSEGTCIKDEPGRSLVDLEGSSIKR